MLFLFFSANGLKYHKERTKCEEPDSWTLELDHGQLLLLISLKMCLEYYSSGTESRPLVKSA